MDCELRGRDSTCVAFAKGGGINKKREEKKAIAAKTNEQRLLIDLQIGIFRAQYQVC